MNRDLLRDLEPSFDVKGGSPKTPFPGMPVSEYQAAIPYVNGTIWKVATSFFASGLIGMTVAWWTAREAKGVSPKELSDVRVEMQRYTDTNSPYARDKELIALQQATQDQKIGELSGKMERVFERLGKIDEKHISYDNSISDLYGKVRLFGDYIEGQKRPVRQ
jgi:hypothetical protein